MLSKKLNTVTPSYTIGISSQVSDMRDQGIDIINFSIGEPDFPTPKMAKNAGIDAILSGQTNYDKIAGLIELRTAIQQKLASENNLNCELDEIVVSNGAKHAITNTLLALLDNEDEVLLPKPYWVSYPEMIKLLGGKPIFIDTLRTNDFKVTPSDIQKHITPRTKLLFLTNPSNPAGMVYGKEELEAIVEICAANNIYILADEIYEKITFDKKFISIASLSETAKNITITINGLSKSAAMTGWRIGYSISNKEIAKAISTVQGHLVSHPSTISQWTATAALTECIVDMDHMVATYKNRRNLVVEKLNQIKDLSFIYPTGAFYVFVDISKFKDRFYFESSYSVAFSTRLLNEAHLAVVPGIAFGMDDFIRIAYACDEASIEEGFKRLETFLNTL